MSLLTFLLSVIGAIGTALFGAWITHIITWKIKAKVDALSSICADLISILTYFSTEYKAPYTPNKDDYRKHLANIQLLDKTVLENEFMPHVQNIITVFMGIIQHDNANVITPYSDKQIQGKLNCINLLLDDVAKKRNEIIKFSYMIKELFWNIQTVIFIITIVLLGIVFTISKSSTVLTAPQTPNTIPNVINNIIGLSITPGEVIGYTQKPALQPLKVISSTTKAVPSPLKQQSQCK